MPMHSSPNTVCVKIHCFVCQVQHKKKEIKRECEAAKIFFFLMLNLKTMKFNIVYG
jgi:hypothetical protein